jgi:hypothetical protein
LWERFFGKTTVLPLLILLALVVLYYVFRITAYILLLYCYRLHKAIVQCMCKCNRGTKIGPDGSTPHRPEEGTLGVVVGPEHTYMDSLSLIRTGGVETYDITKNPEYDGAFDPHTVRGFQTWRCQEMQQQLEMQLKMNEKMANVVEKANMTFSTLDVNDDKVIDRSEFKTGMFASGKSPEQIDAMFDEIDADKSGFLSAAEFQAGFLKLFLHGQESSRLVKGLSDSRMKDEEEFHDELHARVLLGLGRIVALHHRSSASYQTYYHIWYLYC